MIPSKKAFTLLETLLTIVIFTIGVTAVVEAMSINLISSLDAENTSIAMTLAQRRLEEIKNLDYDTEIVNEAKADVSGFTGFQREVTVTEPETDLKQVTVKTYWKFKSGEITTTLVTYISKN